MELVARPLKLHAVMFREVGATLESQKKPEKAHIPRKLGGSQQLPTHRWSADRICVGYNNLVAISDFLFGARVPLSRLGWAGAAESPTPPSPVQHPKQPP